MPCWEHMQPHEQDALHFRSRPQWRNRRKQLQSVMSQDVSGNMGAFGTSTWSDQMHRYVPCEPPVSPHYWLSPFAYSFHDYKDMVLWQHAFDVIYCNAGCNWTYGYKLQVLGDGSKPVTGCGS